jgi:hypothetical protein
MANQLFILKINVAHGIYIVALIQIQQSQSLFVLITKGSDRHDVSLYKNEPPTVDDLMEELEKKTRVPKKNIQLLFRGQKLNLDPSQSLSKQGVFNGNRIVMVGDRVEFFSTKAPWVFLLFSLNAFLVVGCQK